MTQQLEQECQTYDLWAKPGCPGFLFSLQATSEMEGRQETAGGGGEWVHVARCVLTLSSVGGMAAKVEKKGVWCLPPSHFIQQQLSDEW